MLNVSVQITKYICAKILNVFVQVAKYICPYYRLSCQRWIIFSKVVELLLGREMTATVNELM